MTEMTNLLVKKTLREMFYITLRVHAFAFTSLNKT
jgi:hypothetical protein